MLDKAMIFYIGCAMIPSPPSPCMDFGLQGIVVLIIGLIAPKSLIVPVDSFIFSIGRASRKFFGRIPGIRVIVEKCYKLYKLWEKIMKKERKPKNKYLARIFRFILRKDLIQRLIFGYFVTLILGIVLMGIALL